MNHLTSLFDGAFAITSERLMGMLPNLLQAAALMVVGWLLARLLATATRRATLLVESLLARRGGVGRWRLDRAAPVLAAAVYGLVLLFFATAATQALGLQTFTDWLARLLEHVPTVAAGVLIIGAGIVLSGIVGEFVQAATTGLAPMQSAALARIAQVTTLLLALVVGADQIGLKVTWVAVFASVLLVTVMGGAALAASLGARGYVANVIGAHYLGQALQLGQRVRIGDYEGHVLDITATSLVLDTLDGRVLLPARLYHEQAVTVLKPVDGPDA
jgi:small-conductance mechanosensitive channel